MRLRLGTVACFSLMWGCSIPSEDGRRWNTMDVPDPGWVRHFCIDPSDATPHLISGTGQQSYWRIVVPFGKEGVGPSAAIVGVAPAAPSDAPLVLCSTPDGFEAHRPLGGEPGSPPLWSRSAIRTRNTSYYSHLPRMKSFAVQEASDSHHLAVLDLRTGEEMWRVDPAVLPEDAEFEYLWNDPKGDCIIACDVSGSRPATELTSVARFHPSVASHTVLHGFVADEGDIATSTGLVALGGIEPSSGAAPSSQVMLLRIDDQIEARRLTDEFATLSQLAFTPDGTKIGVLTGPDFRVYDVGTGLRLDRFSIPDETGTCFTFNDEGTQVCLGTLAGKVHLVDLILARPETTTATSAEQ